MTTPVTLTAEQISRILALIDRRMAWLAADYPKVDEALYALQQDIEVMEVRK